MKKQTKIIVIICILTLIITSILITNAILYATISSFTGSNIPIKHLPQSNEIYITQNEIVKTQESYSGTITLIISVPSCTASQTIKIYNNGHYQGPSTKTTISHSGNTYTKLLNLNLFEEGENTIQVRSVCNNNDTYINSFTITVKNFPEYKTGSLSHPNNQTINVTLQYQNGVICFDTPSLIVTEDQQINFHISPYINPSVCRWYKNNVLHSENNSTSIISQTNYTIQTYINSTYIEGFSTLLSITTISD